ncbi:S1 family peptidase [Actinoplanes teichomyceticus]|uniref:Trypsin-like peptidase n=1 Tax=Actinoplanes teichomyceticus TaxID=1867 RepID=A0A561VGD4_ACTTI|nr:serine protease [Actinoplanes teichomyceticus]TWG10658.1 trypsin-like peptidase [Actinoplanes teichomyceticus]GIF15428.1 serine protease [Actinoplanes teichomyceticus]
MRLRRAVAVVATAVAATTAVLAGPSPARAATAAGLASTIALSNCSAALVRYPTSVSSDRAMMLTNGHCYEGGLIPAGTVLQNRTSSRSGTLLNASGGSLGTVRADRVLYATMTGTDVALYRLTSTYATISSRYGATALTISASHPSAGASITIPSSYWKRIWTCKIDSFVGTLREDEWTWRDSIRYDAACDTIHGTSGSPIVDATSNQIVGINNTGNDDGEMCTLNNPCEVAADGTTRAYQGQSYGEQTYWFTTCLTGTRTIDLNKAGCLLTKP